MAVLPLPFCLRRTAFLVLLLLLPCANAGAGARRALSRTDAGKRAAESDPCTALFLKLSEYSAGLSSPQFAFARPSDVGLCARSVAFQKDRDLGTLQSVKNYFRNFYGLLHLAQSSPSPGLPSAYDIVAELEQVASADWATADDFYSALARTVDGLNDGHTALELNCPPFLHRLALPLVGVVEAGQPKVLAAPLTLLKPVFNQISLMEPFRFNPAAYAGAHVLSIDGEPAWQHMQEFASSAGCYHDQGQRTNYAFARLTTVNGTRLSSYGAFGIRAQRPKVDAVHMTLIRPGSQQVEDVFVPFISYTPSSNLPGFRNSAAYFNSFCAATQNPGLAHATTAPSLTSAPLPHLPFRVAKRKGLPDRFRPVYVGDIPLPMRAGQDVSPPGNFWRVYKLNDGKTAVVTISTFMPDIPLNTDQQFAEACYWIVQETAKAFATANAFASQILIDVSGNGGGVTSFVPLIIELLVGTEKYAGPGQLRLNPINALADTPLVQELVKLQLGYFNYSGYADMAEQNFLPSDKSKFFFPLHELGFGRNPATGTYSSLFKNGGPSLGNLFGRGFGPAFGSKPVALFSDGLCFSACGEFSMTLRQRFGIPVVAIGGLEQRPMAFSAAGGGFVSEDVTATFLSYFTPEIAAMADAPAPFQYNVSMAMRFVNGFLTQNNGVVDISAPIEFTFGAATVKVPFTPENVADPTMQYLDAASAFFN